jgi:hypothetical protein
MTLSALGIFSAAGAGGVAFASDYELISSQILTGTQSSVTFSGLSSYSANYKHLQIRATARCSTAVTNMGYRIRFNGGTSTDYSFLRLLGNSSAVSAYRDVNATYFYLTGGVIGSTGTANAFGVAVIDMYEAFSGKNKTIKALDASQSQVVLDSSGWYNTGAIDSLVLESDAGSPDFTTGSRFSIYGIKG